MRFFRSLNLLFPFFLIIHTGCRVFRGTQSTLNEGLQNRTESRVRDFELFSFPHISAEDFKRKLELFGRNKGSLLRDPDLGHVLDEMSKQKSWPRRPFTIFESNKKKINASSIQLGPLGILNAAGKLSFATMLGSERQMVLIKRDNNAGVAQFFEPGDQGKLLVEDGQEFVGSCIYIKLVTNSFRAEAEFKLPFFSASRKKAFDESIFGLVYGGFFPVEKGDTIPDLEKICDAVFFDKVAPFIENETKNFLQYVDFDRNSKDSLSLILDAALFTGSAKRLPFEEHHWNVEKASISVECSSADPQAGCRPPGIRVKVKNAELIHSIQGDRDDKLIYSCEYFDEELVRPIDVKVKSRNVFNFDNEAWIKSGKQLAEMICREAMITFRSNPPGNY